MMALHVLKKKGVKASDASGDGIGYPLSISKRHRSVARGSKEQGPAA